MLAMSKVPPVITPPETSKIPLFEIFAYNPAFVNPSIISPIVESSLTFITLLSPDEFVIFIDSYP